MCINTEEDLKIGELSEGWILNKEMKEIHVIMRILEEITYMEYYDYVKKHKSTHLINPSIYTKRFYRVQIYD